MIDQDRLTAIDVASLLHIGRNAVYDLAKSGALPSYRIGRKLFFSLEDVESYLAQARREGPAAPSAQPSTGQLGNAATGQPQLFARPIGAPGSEAPPPPLSPAPIQPFVIAGCGIAADLLVDRLQSGGLPAVRDSRESYWGLVALYKRQAHAALVHLYDQITNKYNVPYAQRLAPGMPIMVFRLVRRQMGFAVSPGNPTSITSWGALAREGVRLANRPVGCGSRVLLDEKLRAMEVPPAAVAGYGEEFATALEAVKAVAMGRADVAVAEQSIVQQTDNVDFVPLQTEWLDLAVAKEGRGRELCRALKALFTDQAFCREYGRIVQGETGQLGAIIYEC